ncbi:MAG: hemerythrin domain-containing protein [Bacteroidetes bacterium]|nr:hemerythrin domain-containing protein [Bacteroidota bacterium]
MANNRADVVTKIHKALRRSLYTTGLAAGKTDFSDITEVEALRAPFKEMVDMLRGHGHHEDTVMIPMLQEYAPNAAHDNSEAHHEIDALIDRLDATYDNVAEPGITAEERAGRGITFFDALNHFTGTYLLHMHMEETVTAPHMWANFTDDQLGAMTGRIIGSMTPQETMMNMKYMLPAVNRSEREFMLGMIRANAPAEAYEAMAALADVQAVV